MVVSDIVHLNIISAVGKLIELQSRIIHELSHNDHFEPFHDNQCECSGVLIWCNLNLQSVKDRIIKTHQEYLLGLTQIFELCQDYESTTTDVVAAKAALTVFKEKRSLLLLFKRTYNVFDQRIALMRNHIKGNCHCPITAQSVTGLMTAQTFFRNIIRDSNSLAEDILIAIDEFNRIIISDELADSSVSDRPVVRTDSGIVTDSSSIGAFYQPSFQDLSSMISNPEHVIISDMNAVSKLTVSASPDNGSQTRNQKSPNRNKILFQLSPTN